MYIISDDNNKALKRDTHTYDTGKASLIVSCQMENNDNFNGICMLFIAGEYGW